LLVFNLNHRYTAVSRISNQGLTAPAIYSLELEIGRIRRHNTCAFEPTPLGRSTIHVAQNCRVASDLNPRAAIHHHLDRTLTAIGIAAPDNGGLPGRILPE